MYYLDKFALEFSQKFIKRASLQYFRYQWVYEIRITKRWRYFVKIDRKSNHFVTTFELVGKKPSVVTIENNFIISKKNIKEFERLFVVLSDEVIEKSGDKCTFKVSNRFYQSKKDDREKLFIWERINTLLERKYDEEWLYTFTGDVKYKKRIERLQSIIKKMSKQPIM